jgi:hypothetical protein
MVHGYGYVELEMGVYAQDHRNLSVRPFGADRPHVRKLPSLSPADCPEEQERTDDTVRGHATTGGELL